MMCLIYLIDEMVTSFALGYDCIHLLVKLFAVSLIVNMVWFRLLGNICGIYICGIYDNSDLALLLKKVRTSCII